MKFGDMDGPPPIRKVLGDEAFNNLPFLKNGMKPVLEKGGVMFYRASTPVFGGPAGTVETVRMLKNLGEIDGGPLQNKVLGAAGAQALAAKAAALTRGPNQQTIMRVRPELLESAS